MIIVAALLASPPAEGAIWFWQELDRGTLFAPGEVVTAQQVHILAYSVAQPTTRDVYFYHNWTDAEKVEDGDTYCASTQTPSNFLAIGVANFGIPTDRKILGMEVIVGGSCTSSEGWVRARLRFGARTTEWYDAPLPEGDCGCCQPVSIWGPDFSSELWTPQEINDGGRIELQAEVPEGQTVYIDYVTLHVWYAEPAQLGYIVVRNTEISNPLLGSEVTKIEVVRVSDGRVIGSQSNSSELNKLTLPEGVKIPISQSYRAFTGELVFEIRLYTKSTTPLFRKLWLGHLIFNVDGSDYATYPWRARPFEVGPSPQISFDEEIEGAEVYPGQRFIAGRLVINASNVPFSFPINQIKLFNIAGNPLPGNYVAKLEIRRTMDDALIGEATATELAKLSTTGTTIIPSSTANTVPAYSELQLDIWVTTKPDAPVGKNLRLGAEVRCQYYDFPSGSDALFTVGEPGGMEEVEDEPLTSGNVFSGQRFLAQRVKGRDDDPDPYDVTINSVVVQNVADPAQRLSESYIAKIELIRARDGAVLGQVSNVNGLNTGGVRIVATSNNTVRDDAEEVLEVWVTLGQNVPPDRRIRLKTIIWHTENAKQFSKSAEGAAEFVTGATTGIGFETVDLATLSNRTVYQGARFLAQRFTLGDNDLNPYDVSISSIVIRNVITDVPLADQHIARIEICRANDGALLGEVSDPVGLSLAGVRITTSTNNLVADDTSVQLEIWVTLKDTAPKGRKLRLRTVVWHTEGSVTVQTPDTSDKNLEGPTFTTDIGQPPQNVDFSWSPEKPEAGKEVTFTPSPNITDPSGNISQATFRWEFGDGQSKETTGPSSVKHTYTRGGTFSVKLTVTNTGGLSASKTKEIEVIGKQPTVNFTFTPAEPTTGETVTFTATITDPATPPLSPYTYKWDFGDGNTVTQQSSLTQQTVTHAYTAAGTFTVTLEVTNSRGETGKAQKQITVSTPVARPPTVTSLTASTTTPAVGQNVTFTATATTGADTPITGWKWDFGDGTPVQETADTATTMSVTHAFQNVGTYTVRVWARNSAGWSQERSTQIVVHPAGVEFGTVVLDNPATGNQCRIQIFAPAGATDLKITILDQAGRPVVREKSVSVGTFTWDLRGDNGQIVPNGLYLMYVTANVGGETKRTEIYRILVRR